MFVVNYTRVFTLENGLALTPFMGWNSWNHWRCAMNESVIRPTAGAVKSSGMAAVGYQYVSLDECRVLPKCDGKNRPVADPNKFPSKHSRITFTRAIVIRHLLERRKRDVHLSWCRLAWIWWWQWSGRGGWSAQTSYYHLTDLHLNTSLLAVSCYCFATCQERCRMYKLVTTDYHMTNHFSLRCAIKSSGNISHQYQSRNTVDLTNQELIAQSTQSRPSSESYILR